MQLLHFGLQPYIMTYTIAALRMSIQDDIAALSLIGRGRTHRLAKVAAIRGMLTNPIALEVDIVVKPVVHPNCTTPLPALRGHADSNIA